MFIEIGSSLVESFTNSYTLTDPNGTNWFWCIKLPMRSTLMIFVENVHGSSIFLILVRPRYNYDLKSYNLGTDMYSTSLEMLSTKVPGYKFIFLQ